VSDDLRQAVEYAAWWTRKALDLAAGERDAHPGLEGHLTAADVQHRAAEHLISLDGEHVRQARTETEGERSESPSEKAAA